MTFSTVAAAALLTSSVVSAFVSSPYTLSYSSTTSIKEVSRGCLKMSQVDVSSYMSGARPVSFVSIRMHNIMLPNTYWGYIILDDGVQSPLVVWVDICNLYVVTRVLLHLALNLRDIALNISRWINIFLNNRKELKIT